MPEPRLQLKVNAGEVLAGESLLVTASYANEGSGPAPIVDPDDPSPLVYTLRPIDPAGKTYVISHEDFQTELARGPRPATVRGDPQMLDPRHSVSRVEDLAEIAGKPLLPGAYELEAVDSISCFEAESTRVEIKRPRLAKIESILCPLRRKLAQVAAHRSEEGITLLHRESYAGLPLFGCFRRRIVLPGVQGMDGLAIAVDSAAVTSGRWFAWLEESRFGAAHGWGSQTTQTRVVVAGLQSPRLLTPGFQTGEGSAMFFLAGIHKGELSIARYVAAQQSLELTGGAHLGSGLMPPRIALAISRHYFHLFWLENGGRSLVWRVLDDRMRPVSPEAKTVATFEHSIGTFSVMPVSGSHAPSVHVLAADPVKRQLAYRRFRCGADAVHEGPPFRLGAPDFEVTGWAIGDGGVRLPVLARSATGISFTWAENDGLWMPFGVSADLEGLHVFHQGTPKYWITWVDPNLGVQYRPLPGPSR